MTAPDFFRGIPRRVESDGFIRWYDGDGALVREVKAADYYAERDAYEVVEYAALTLDPALFGR